MSRLVTVIPISYADVQAAPELLAEYEAECAMQALGPMNPHWAMYAALEEAGVFQAWGVYLSQDHWLDNPTLVGFACVLNTINPHSGVRLATVESLFVAKTSRATGAGTWLMKVMERSPLYEACKVMLYSAPVGGDLEKLLERSKGYERTNSCFCKPLR